MKTVKAICATLFLALSLSIPAYADNTNPGEVHTPGRSSQATCGTETPERQFAAPCTASIEASDSNFPDLGDIMWALALIF
jgi:hypothetical protein